MTLCKYSSESLLAIIESLTAERRLTPDQARCLAGAVVEAARPTFDADDPATWQRYSETSEDGGTIALVRYPEGFRLRFNGETVWKQGEKPAQNIVVTIDAGSLRNEIARIVAEYSRYGGARG